MPKTDKELTTEIVVAYINANAQVAGAKTLIGTEEITSLIVSVHETIIKLKAEGRK